MTTKTLAIVVLGIAAAAALPGCTVLTPGPARDEPAAAPLPVQGDGNVDLKAIYSDLGRSGGKVFALDPRSSTVRIYAFRGGRAAKLAHNHVLSAAQFSGYFYLPPGGAWGARFDLEFRLDQLEIDDPAKRAALGSAFASKLSPADIEGSRKHMLGDENLQADRYPFVRIHSLQVSGDGTKFAAKVQVELHGQKRELWVPLDVEGLPQRLSVTGSMVLRQTDFGAQPYSVLNGLIAVQDEVVVEFKLLGA